MKTCPLKRFRDWFFRMFAEEDLNLAKFQRLESKKYKKSGSDRHV